MDLVKLAIEAVTEGGKQRREYFEVVKRLRRILVLKRASRITGLRVKWILSTRSDSFGKKFRHNLTPVNVGLLQRSD